MNRKYAAWITHVAHHRISLLLGNLADFHQKLNTLLRTLPGYAFRLRRTCRGPGWESPAPCADHLLQVGLQGFGWTAR